VNALHQPPNIPSSTSLNDLLKGGLVKWDLGLMLIVEYTAALAYKITPDGSSFYLAGI
jgi:hypothetical protein